MTEEADTSEPRSGPAVSVVGPGDGETIAGRPLTPQAGIDAMSRYATKPAADST